MSDQYFLSYSRRQYYFAESLARYLSEQDVNIWFDIQQLTPGIAWADALQNGLKQSQRIILIVSHAAFESPHVALEWQHAIETGKPITLVIFEAVEVPAELEATATSIIDFRADFEKAAARLLKTLTSDKTEHDPIPTPNRFRFPRRLPRDVWLVAVSLFAPGLLALIAVVTAPFDWVYFFPDGSVNSLIPFENIALYVIVYGALAGVLLVQGWAFLRRHVNYHTMRFLMPLAVVIALIVYLLWAASLDFVGSRPFLPVPVFLGLTFLIWLFDLFIFFRTSRRSVDVLRWLPTGEAPDSLRTMHHYQGASEKGKSRKGVTYRLSFAEQDQGIADDVTVAMNRHDMKQVNDGDAEYDILILSHYTPRAMLESVLQRSGNIINILASRANIPDELGQVTNYQWVDYRARQSQLLKALAEYLNQTEPGPMPFQLRALPEALDKPVAPPRVIAFTNIIRLLASINVVVILMTIFLAVGVPFFQLLTTPLSVILNLISVVLTFLLIWLMATIINRQISIRTFNYAMIIYLGSSLLIRIITDPNLSNGIGFLVALLIYFVLFQIFHPAMRKWLPPATGRQPSESALGTSSLMWLSLRRVLSMAVALGALLWVTGIFFTSPIDTLPPKAGVDGQIVYVANGSSGHLMLMDGSSVNQTALVERDPEIHREFTTVRWSPDKSQIAFFAVGMDSARQLTVINADGSNRREISEFSAHYYDWSPDGTQIVVTLRDGLENFVYTTSVEEPDPQLLLDIDGVEQETRWSPDGSKILFFQQPNIYMVDAAGGEPSIFATLNMEGIRRRSFPLYDWSPDGERIAYLSGMQVLVATPDGDSEVIADLSGQTVVRDDRERDITDVQTVAWSPDGEWLAVQAYPDFRSAAMYVMRPDGSDMRQILPDENSMRDFEIVWSPNSDQFVLTISGDLHTINRDGSGLQAITNDGRGAAGMNEYPDW